MKKYEAPVDQFLSLGKGDAIKAFATFARSSDPKKAVLYRSAVATVIEPTLRISESRLREMYNGEGDYDAELLRGFDDYTNKGWLIKDIYPDLYKFENSLFEKLVPGVMGFLLTNERIIGSVLYNNRNLGLAINDFAADVSKVQYIVQAPK